MELEVFTSGCRVGRRGRLIRVTRGGEVVCEVPVSKLSMVIVSGRVSVSSEAVRLLAENGVPVLFMCGWRPVALLHGFFMHGTVLTRREQIAAYRDWRGVHLAKGFVRGGLVNKAQLLRYFAASRGRSDGGVARVLEEAASEIFRVACEVDGVEGESVDEVRFEIMGLEAEGARLYYEALRLLLPEEAGFERRERRPPRDPVNACLSYGYSLLNAKCLAVVAACGLEPYAGFLHADRSGKPSLVLDLSEEFRQPVVDRTVVSLFSKGELRREDFSFKGGFVVLEKRGREVLLRALNERFRGEVRVDGGSAQLGSVISRQARMVARFLLGKAPKYEPFFFDWH
ncbi:MAG: CRISPR-associated endonuclease Cas1 [Candidatus Jordarchaeales archaeon]